MAMPTQMLPTPGARSRAHELTSSRASHCRGVEIEAPAVVGRRQLVAVRLLRPAGVVVRDVIAHGVLDLTLGWIEADAEHARADRGVEPPRLHVDRAARTKERRGVA